ncbi:TonB-dependent receptor [Sphingomonas gellani]|uniref:TonB-dependent receptor n=1 Tax=Sphingomonas gellani TaxID=1166340 RepID=A0A1H8CXC5_9SPHN|nr:TonB-dependent receptor [Sphingomonas gellani]SEM99650.1 TonB-dependent receptor [Sphingomonas gellani]
MSWKSLLCVSVSSIVGLAGIVPMTASAQTAPATAPDPATAQEAPKPDAPSDQSANPAAVDASSQDSTPTDSGDVVVTGLRRSLASAQNIKRLSDGIVDAVVAEDIGKLPDTFASSALQRVAGVNVTRGGGESAGVTVRGLPDLTTTYNGRQIFTAEGRYVQIQDFPAGTVQALEVYKSGLANQIEGGIAGEVNVRGRRPFDFQGFELSGSLNGVLSQQSEKIVPNGNLLISDRWNTGIGEMGLLVNASYVGINFLDSSREQSVVIASTNVQNSDGTVSNRAPGQPAGLRFPDAQGNFLGYGARYRPSANAAFQWKPTPELEIYADGLYQGFRSKDYNRWMFMPIFGDITLTNVTTFPGSNQISSATVSGSVRPDGYTGSFNGKTDTYQGGGGVNWKKDRLEISADVAYTNSKYTANLVNVDYAAASSPVRNVNFDASKNGGPSQEFVNFSLGDPANFIARGLYQELLEVSGKDWQARTDLSYDLDMGFLKRLQVGLRYNDRDAARDFGNLYNNFFSRRPDVTFESLGIPLSSLPGSDVRVTLPGFTFDDAQPNIAYAAMTRDSIRDNLPALRSFFKVPAGTVPFDQSQRFRANEKSYAVYGQLKYGFDLGNITVDGLAGLRAVKTKTVINGVSRQQIGTDAAENPIYTFSPDKAGNEYTDYLPNASARVAFTDKLQMRLAYTKTRTRPNFIDLRPNLTVGTPPTFTEGNPCLDPTSTTYNSRNCARGGSQGNPNLKPLTSNNYDLSMEYYFSKTGFFSAAVFRHDVKGFLSTVNTVYRDPTYGLVAIDRPVNLGNTRLQGAEMQFTSFLDFDGLPEWVKGFGVQANGTFIDAKGDLQDNFAQSYNNEQQRFPGVSRWSYNLVGLYERPQFSGRLAYNYRSKFVSYYSFETFDPIAHPTMEQGRGQLDGSLSVTPVPNITLAFDVANILGNPIKRDRAYNTGDVYRRQVFYIERSYSLGVRFRF